MGGYLMFLCSTGRAVMGVPAVEGYLTLPS